MDGRVLTSWRLGAQTLVDDGLGDCVLHTEQAVSQLCALGRPPRFVHVGVATEARGYEYVTPIGLGQIDCPLQFIEISAAEFQDCEPDAFEPDRRRRS